jgi:hypothetical protein
LTGRKKSSLSSSVALTLFAFGASLLALHTIYRLLTPSHLSIHPSFYPLVTGTQFYVNHGCVFVGT